ncbi:hypothetical protein V5O48_003296 [Marasmius crinis-equi]|uniref:Uncharacterized protein n=1 Tax=Marasmius crinis-equi TaxID=585013 RepID=A0ABR3FT68_9AGAR
MELCPQFVRTDGWMSLAGTHFHFIREIPMMARYEIRVSFVTWDQKWVFAFCRFVTKRKPRRPLTLVSLARRSDKTSDIDTKKLNGIDLDHTESDGATVHAIAVSQLCFKMGRITVPPALVFASNGLSKPPPSTFPPSPAGFSHANPPPHWRIVKSMISRLEGGDIKNLRALYTGGWKDVPASQRWWEQALGGDLELQRQENMEKLSLLKRGRETLRPRPGRN